MEDELFELLYHIVLRHAGWRRGPRRQYADGLIVLVYYWSVICDRPMNWACAGHRLPAGLSDRRLPSATTLGRRLRSGPVVALIDRIEAQLLALHEAALVRLFVIDAKPLRVGDYSKDRQARWGFACRGKARGYKLFLLCDGSGRTVAWRVGAMNRSERDAACELIPHARGPGYLLGDAMYGTRTLYRLADAHGLVMIAPRARRGGFGNPRPPASYRRAAAMLETHVNRFGPTLYAQRVVIERLFGQLGGGPCGLKPLPDWVRTLDRVRRYVQAKIVLFALRQQMNLRR